MGIARMVFEYKFTGFKSPPQGADNNEIDFDLFHFLLGIETLLDSFLGDLDVEIVLAEFSGLVLISFHVALAMFIFNLGLNKVVLGLGMSDEVNHNCGFYFIICEL